MVARCSGVLVLVSMLVTTTVQSIQAQQDLRGPSSRPNFVAAKIVEEDGLTQLKISSGQGPQTREQAYTVQVPYTQNGETKVREEQRVRTVTISADTPPISKLLEDVKFRMVNGKEVDVNTAKVRMKNAVPAIMMTEGGKLDPFFAEILKPETIIILLPKI